MKMTIHAPTAITADELLAMGDIGRCELIRGKIIMMSPSSAGHGVVIARMGALIHTFVDQHDLGVTLGAETGFVIERGPDTVRAPDVAVVLKIASRT
jgi:Uma2 family endonuclease